MKRTTTTAMGLAALVAMLTLGVFSAGTAQAHTFLWTGALSSLLLGLSDNSQIFFAEEGGGAIICKHARFHGVVVSERALEQIAVGEYSRCEGFGHPATVTPAEFLLSADETASVVNKTIQVSIPSVPCTIEIEPNANNQNLSKIRYLVDPQDNTRLLFHAEVEKIHSIVLKGAGLCGVEGLHSNGLYRGLALAWVDGSGTLSWS